jgi:hypothetical protein
VVGFEVDPRCLCAAKAIYRASLATRSGRWRLLHPLLAALGVPNRDPLRFSRQFRKDNSANFGLRGFSEVGDAFLAEALLDPAVGQPLGEQILGALGPPAGFVS